MFLHATCIAIDGKGVLLTGPSGVGKSDLAIRLIDMGARLVADDQTFLFLKRKVLWASPPEKLAGLIEVRPVGLMRLSYMRAVKIALYVELFGENEGFERMPEPTFYSLLDCSVRALKLPARAASTPAVIRTFLKERNCSGKRTRRKTACSESFL